MKTKTRKLIGNILVWGGLGVIFFTNIWQVIDPLHFFGQLVGDTQNNLIINSELVISQMIKYGWINIGAAIALLIGGLWGMRK